LKELLKVASGGVIFSAIQKFMPDGRACDNSCLSERRPENRLDAAKLISVATSLYIQFGNSLYT
jgi:hypothetical protein